MKSIACTISYGKTEIDYELLMMNRKSLEIAVHPDKSVVVKAPKTSSLEAIEGKVKKRARWIKRQISYFNQFDPRTPDRKYVGGDPYAHMDGVAGLAHQHRIALFWCIGELPAFALRVIPKGQCQPL